MKSYYFFKKYLHEFIREPAILLIILFLPAAFIGIYYLAFGGGQNTMAQLLSVSVLNRDSGPHGAALIEALKNATFDGSPALSVEPVRDLQQGETMVKENSAVLLLIIPADFSLKLQQRGTGGTAAFELAGDPSADLFNFARSFVVGIVDTYVKQQIGWHKPPSINIRFVEHTGTLNDFQIAIPGLLIFGILFNIASTSLWVVRESASGMLRRVQISAARSGDLFVGITLMQSLVCLLQVLVALGAALLLGFRPIGSLVLCVYVCFLSGLTATGLGLLLSAFTETTMGATTLSTAALLPMAFLSGAAFPVPAVPLGSLWGFQINLFDFLPATHAVNALTRILVYGDSASQLIYPLVSLLLLSILIYSVGIFFFQKYRLES
ncbi:MAG: ABC transporter permease [Anaerolineae bacterium]|nr:ABC transporter permease [Anaerolineae bacterium]